MIKWIGQHIVDIIARFRSDVYLEDISSGTIASGGNLGLDSNNKVVKQGDTGITDLHGAGVDGSASQLLTDDGDGTVTSESTLTYDDETLTIGVDDNGGAAIMRKPHSDEAGGKLDIWGGNAGGTDKTGGNLNLYSGAGTGTGYGGDINFYAGNADGSSGSTNNIPTLMATIDGSAGDFLMSGIDLIRGKTDSDFAIQSEGSMSFTLDRDNDETSQKFSFNNYTTEIGYLDEDGNLVIRGTITAQTAAGATKYPAKGSAGNFMVDDAGVLSTRTGAQVVADLSGQAGADFAMNSHKITGVTDPTSDQDASTKKYVDDNAINNTRAVNKGGTGATSLTDNAILTGTGTSAITAESTLSYSSEILDIGADDDGVAQVRRKAHADDDGGDLYIRGGDATAGQTDKDGGILRLYGGRGTSNGAGGGVSIFTSFATGSTGTVLHTNARSVASFRADGDTILGGDLIFEGPVVDGNDTKFSITEQTANRTITVPNATGTMCVSGADGSNMIVLGSGTGYVNAPAAQKWYFGNTLYGFNHFNWAGVNVSMVSDSSTFTLSEDYNGIGQFVPAVLSKVVARVSCRPASTSDETFKVTICSADRDAGGTNTTWTALASATNETSIGVWEACDATYTGSIATSKMLAIGVGIDESSVSTGNVRFNWQLVGYLT